VLELVLASRLVLVRGLASELELVSRLGLVMVMGLASELELELVSRLVMVRDLALELVLASRLVMVMGLASELELVLVLELELELELELVREGAPRAILRSTPGSPILRYCKPLPQKSIQSLRPEPRPSRSSDSPRLSLAYKRRLLAHKVIDTRRGQALYCCPKSA
jgi:hypothetical protein